MDTMEGPFDSTHGRALPKGAATPAFMGREGLLFRLKLRVPVWRPEIRGREDRPKTSPQVGRSAGGVLEAQAARRPRPLLPFGCALAGAEHATCT